LTPDQALRLVSAYGSRLQQVLGEARAKTDLGQSFGADLTEAEVRYLMTKEWARFADDILWRRAKLGLTMGSVEREQLAAFMASVASRVDSPKAVHSAAVEPGPQQV
jgi:glycerol-3-phosphate dehydrogenase